MSEYRTHTGTMTYTYGGAPARDGFRPVPAPDASMIFTQVHEHTWRFIRTRKSGNGGTSPIYRCSLCRAEAVDLSQQYGGTNPDTGELMPDTRSSGT